jgi:hypothetical protein
MDELEIKLNKLPKANMPKRIDANIRIRIFFYSIKASWMASFENMEIRRYSIVTAGILLLLTTIVGLPAYAYVSKGITPENPLYVLRRGVENMETVLTPIGIKPALHIKLAERRLAEASILSERPQNEKIVALRINVLEDAQMETQKAESANFGKSRDIDKNFEVKKAELAIIGDKEIHKIADDVTIDMNSEIIENVAVLLDNQIEKKFLASGFRPEEDISAAAKFPAIASTAPETIATTALPEAKTDRQDRPKPVDRYEFKPRTENHIVIGAPRLEKTASSSAAGLARGRLESIKKDVDTIKASGTAGIVNNKNAKKLFDRLKEKLDNAETKINAGNLNEADKDIAKTETLENFTRRLLSDKSASSTPMNLNGKGGVKEDKNENPTKKSKRSINDGIKKNDSNIKFKRGGDQNQ